MDENKNFEFPIIAFDKEEYNAVQNWITTHKDVLTNKCLYIFGAGIRGNMILKFLEEAKIQVAGFCDNSIEKQDGFVKGYKIFNPQEICCKPEKNYILVSPEHSIEIESILETKGYVKEKNLFTIKNNSYGSYQTEFFRAENIEYVLFGDCYFTDLDVDDLYGKSMGELAIEKLGEQKAKVLSVHGMCIPSFYYLMQLQIELGIIPKAVAFIVNIPFCNGIQTKLPQSQHIQLLRMIQEKLPLCKEEFDSYISIAESRSHNINASSFSTKGNAKSKDANYVEKLLTKTRYMYDFKEDNENIEYLKKMLALLRANNIKPLPFIPALNYHAGIEFYGDEFVDKYTRICNGIKECIKEYNVDILDMSFALEKSFFSGDRLTKFPNKEGKEKEISLLCRQLQL